MSVSDKTASLLLIMESPNATCNTDCLPSWEARNLFARYLLRFVLFVTLLRNLLLKFGEISEQSPNVTMKAGFEFFLNVKASFPTGKHIGVSRLTRKKVKPIKNSAVRCNLLHCNYLPSFDNFSILAHENKKFLLEIKESLLITRDKPLLNRNISFAPFYLLIKYPKYFCFISQGSRHEI